MKPWSRFLLGTALACLFAGAAQAAASLSVTGFTPDPASVKPGDTVSLSVAVVNNGAATPADDFPAGGTATASATFTHLATGATFSRSFTVTAQSVVAGAKGAGALAGTFTVPLSTTQAGAYRASVTLSAPSSGSIGSGTFAVSSTALTITGKPDLAITGLTYTAGTAYKGGDVVPMTLTFTNRVSTNSVTNVPYVPSLNGDALYSRVEVILSSNPTFGDGDDFLLTSFDLSASFLAAVTGNGGNAYLDADGANRTLSWNQILPGNFAGSYYVMAKIDTLSGVNEVVDNDLAQNGNNTWSAPDTNGARISLLPTNFATVYWASRSGNAYSDNPSITADGRYTVFASDSTNLVTGDANGVRDIFLYDNQASNVRRISLSQQGAQANAGSQTPAISGDGRYVAFSSDATNLILTDTNGFSDIFVVDTITGAISLESVGPAGVLANGSNYKPALSHDGRYVVWESSATNLVAGGTAVGVTQVYRRDRTTGTTVLVSQSTAGVAGSGSSLQAAISADGQYVAFASDATNLVAADTNAVRDIFLRDVTAGTTVRVSVATAGTQADGASRAPSINRNTGAASDGRYIAFGSEATNLVAGDTNAVSDIFVYDRVAATTTRVSVSSAGAQASDPSAAGSRLGSINPGISASGRYVVFASLADNLTAGDLGGRVSATDANGALDVFVMDRDVSGSGTFDTPGNIATSLASVNRFGYQTATLLGTPSTAASDIYPVISADGRWVALPSDAENTAGLVHGATNRTSPDLNTFRDVFLFDRRTNALPGAGTPPTVAIATPGAGSTALVNTPTSVTASATASVGVISSVQFFVNGTSLGTSTVFPYAATWTPTAVGSYTLSAIATDSFGNQAVSANVAVTINAAPSVGITGPAAGSTITVNTARTVTAAASATTPGATITSVQFLANGVSLGTDTTAPYSVSWTPGASGNYSLTAVATDSLGTVATSPAVAVVVNNGPATPPTVSVSSPAAGATLSVNTPTTVSAAAFASNATVTTVQFYANGIAIGSSAAFPFSIAWTPAVPGTYALTAVATDTNGSSATSAATTVAVSTGTAPSVTLASPVSGTTVVIGSTETLIANATAGSGTLTGVQFYADGVLIGTDTTFPYNVSWSPTGLGSVVLTAVATNSLGSRTTSVPLTVTVAGTSVTAPQVAITSPGAGAALPVGSATTLTASALDPDGSIAGVQFLVNGVLLGTDTTFPYSVPFTPVSPGTYVLTAKATDNGGNVTTSAPVSVSVAANASPSVAITSPAASASVAVNSPQTITASASAPGGVVASVQFFVNGVALSTDLTFPYTAAWSPSALGAYSLTARVTDQVGNITDSAPVTLTVAATAAPVVAVTSPVAGSAHTVGATLNLAATASDPDGTIASVQFLVNGLAQGALDTAAPYTVAWTPASVGVYAVTAQATDNSGNVTTSAPVTVTIGANASPTVALSSPADGLSYGLGQQVLVAASASDADGTVAGVQFYANGLLLGSAAAVPYTLSWRPAAAGSYAVTAVATDNSGNVATSSAVQVVVTSAGAPAVQITQPAAGASLPVGVAVPVAATTSGGNGPTAQVQFFVNGVPLVVDQAAPYAANWTPAAPGSYALTVVATDSAGVSAGSVAVNVTVTGNAAPVVAVTTPARGQSVTAGTPLALAATATDVDGTVVSVRFLANGNPVATVASAPFTASWAPSAAGTYAVVAQATDNSGNVTSSEAVSVTVIGNRPPAVALTAPLNGSAVRVAAGTRLTATASDADGTISSVQFFANGVAVGAPVTVPPYVATWTPSSEGIHRLTAVAVDNAGAATTSATVTVIVVAANAADAVYAGTYSGAGESGRFALVSVRGRTGAFIAYSTSGTSRTYHHPGLALDASGGFAGSDASGRVLITGSATDTGASGTLDNGRLTFIGPVVLASGGVPAGYYTGNLTGRAASVVAAIVGGDGGITAYVTDGTAFRDAGAGMVAANGAFALTTQAGNRLAGTLDPASGFLSGTLTGGPGGAFLAASGSGVSFSDGFLRNLSTRGQVGTGANVLIAGFVVAGNTPKRVLVRAVGPSLSGFGVTGSLADTQLELYAGSNRLASNDNWAGDFAIQTASAEAGAFPLANDSLDSAVLMTLQPGSYSAQVSGVAGRTGVAMVELYDLDSLTPFSSQKLMNVATRGVVGTGPNLLIAGFVVSGNTAKKVMVRGVGPTLGAAPFNVPGVLADPVLRLVRGDNVVVRENDNWETGNDARLVTEAAGRVGAFGLGSGSRDAVILVNLPPGIYTAQLTGAGTSTGVGLIEVYEVP